MENLIQSWFPNLETCIQDTLINQLQSISLQPGKILFEQGKSGEALYILQEGHLAVTRTTPDGLTIPLNEFQEPGTIMGEMALVSGLPRNATIRAVTTSQLFRLSKDSFATIVAEYPILLDVFTEWFVARLQKVQIGGVLINLFGDLDAATLNAIQAKLDWVHLSSGETLFEQDDPGDAMYIIASGRLAIAHKNGDGVRRVSGEAGPGETIGEFALLTNEKRNATVYAIRETIVAKLTAPIFEELVAEYPQAMMHITRIIIQRNQQITQANAHSGSSFRKNNDLGFVLVATNEDVNLKTIIPKLVKIISHFGSTLHLNSQHFDELYGREGAAQTPFDNVTNMAIIDWLNQQERKYRYIVYEMDEEWTPWTQRCLQYADRVLLVADAHTNPQPGRMETRIQQEAGKAHAELLLFHEDSCELPSNTAVWLANRNLYTHHHIRYNNEKDWQRAGRRLVGKAIGLVLSGGGARSLNQIGALRAFEEAGIPIDMIGAVSMGALIGGSYSLEHSRDKTYRMFKSFGAKKKLLDITLPIASIFASKKITNLLINMAEDVNIEDAWRPFFCMSTNVTKAIPVVHQTGLLWRALRASMSVPSLFLPVTEDGDLLVDGGVMNNLPVDVMADQPGAGFVIAINNNTNDVEKEKYDFEPGLSGWKLLWQRINPFTEPPKTPNIFGHHTSCFSVNFIYHRKSIMHKADLMIVSPVDQFTIFGFDAIDEIIQVGYETTKQQLEAWQEAGGQLPPNVLFEEMPSTIMPEENNSDLQKHSQQLSQPFG